MSNPVWGIILKDLKAIMRNRQVWLPMLILPLVLSAFMPAVFIIGLDRGARNVSHIAPILKMVPAGLQFETNLQKLFYVVLNFMFPPLFLMIPLIASSIIGASCLVGEKENKTLETLLYTPVTLRQLFFSKLLATFIPAYVVTLTSFAVFTLVVHLMGGAYLQEMPFPNLKWLVLIFLVSPSVILFGLSAMVVISAYASTFQGAQQLSGFIAIPFMGLIIAQTSGVLPLETQYLVVGAPLLLVFDYLIISFCLRRLTYERLLE